MNLVEQILWKGRNPWLMRGAVVGAFAGLLILLLSVQTYLDVGSIASGTQNYVMVNKKISVLSTALSFLGAESNTFEDNDLQKVASQPFVKSVAPLVSNAYRVSCENASLGFHTDLFFQSLPSKFLDVDSARFRWREGDQLVPLILSYDYLALYNFAYAPSMGFPPLTEGTIGNFEVDLYLNGKGMFKQFKGRIVGFSRRINSILVPQSFLDYSNAAFGEKRKLPTQLMLEVDNIYSKEFVNFLEEEKLEVTRGLGDKVKSLANVFTPMIAGIGVLLVLLSFLVFLLNFRLIVSESSSDIRQLIQIGYKPKDIASLLHRKLLWQIGLIVVLVAVSLLIIRFFASNWFVSQGFEVSFFPHWLVWLIFGSSAATIAYFNISSVNKNIENLTK